MFKRRIPWARKPSSPKIDWSDQLNKGLLCQLIDSDNGFRDLVKEQPVTSTGVQTVAPKRGRVLHSNGTDQWGSYAVDLSATDKITVSFWLYWDAFSNNNDMVMEHSPNINSNNGFYLLPNSSAASDFETIVHSSSTGGYSGSKFARPTGAAWHHYCLSYDRSVGLGTSCLMAVYVDGVSQSLVSTQTNDVTGNFGNETLYLMSRGGASLFGAGKLDDIRIHDRLLSANEAKALYENSFQTLQPRTQYLPLTVPAALSTGMFKRRIPWARKPNGTPSIDWSNPLSKDLSQAIFNFRRDSVRKANLVESGNPVHIRGNWVNDGTDDAIDLPSGTFLNSSDYTIFIRFSVTSYATKVAAGANATPDTWIGSTSSGYTFRAPTTQLTHNATDTGVLHTLACVSRGGNAELYFDGTLSASAGAQATQGGGESKLGQYGSNTSYNLDGEYEYFIKYDRALSASEIKSISDNPYQIIQPRTQYIPVGVAAAPSGFKVGWALAGRRANIIGAGHVSA